jgi:hypothetical protein
MFALNEASRNINKLTVAVDKAYIHRTTDMEIRVTF